MKIQILDTTLRDGEQSPGNSMTTKEKFLLAMQLERLGVDIIEAGFPIASQGDFDGVMAVAKAVKLARVAGLCRANFKDIDRAWEALQYAGERARIHTFIATSPIHMEKKLRMSEDAVLEQAVAAVRYARNLAPEVQFSCEDAVRSKRPFLARMVVAVAEAGAAIINIPDTVGFADPEEYGSLFRYLAEFIPGSMLSAHCHNDLGMATANSLAAARNGAGQVECTINGIGERAGNCSLEEIVMAFSVKKSLRLECGVKTELLVPTSQLLTSITGMYVQPNKAIVGANAFAHESGIHQHGVLSDPETYEIMTPASVGLDQSKLVLAKHSGKAALSKRLEELGFNLDSQAMEDMLKRFKDLADKKGEIFDEDLLSLMGVEPEPGRYKLENLTVTTGTDTIATATVILSIDGQVVKTAELGDGPVDAIGKAIKRLTGNHIDFDSLSIGSVSKGTAAQGNAAVKLKKGSVSATGRASGTDIMVASAYAIVDALNRIDKSSATEQLI